MKPTDHAARSRALDPKRSFIVQAPAGSGKTEVLTQRFLTLLATVEHPEQVLAITFTRKAANEMKRRVLDRLQDAGRQAEGQELDLKEHEQFSTDLAGRALKHAEARDWSLLENPQRLNINTIDTLNASLVRQMPYLSRLGGQLNIIEDAAPLYAEAAKNTVALLDRSDQNSTTTDEDAQLLESLRQALLNLDGRSDRLQAMLETMLSRRDQWLRFSGQFDYRDEFVTAMRHQLDRMLEQELAAVRSMLEDSHWQQIITLARFASSHIEKPDHPLHAVAQIDPDSMHHWGLDEWRVLAAAALTSGGTVRKSVNVNDGFAAKIPQKEAFLELLSSLAEQPRSEDLLNGLLNHPPSMPDEPQVDLLFHLGRIVRRANTELFDLFARRGEIDFIGIAEQARVALGTDENPTDLALHMDYRLQHILMDEFQDTSNTQFILLKSLIRGWSEGDGRSLFLVGDPMQSIYRFREADVGLFSKVQQEGAIGDVSVESLQLQTNFRSNPALVSLFNEVFPQVLADEDRPQDGAVSYAPATPGRDQASAKVLRLALLDKDGGVEQEARWVVDQVESALADDLKTVAILVRSRSHALAIVEQLKERQIDYQGIDMDPLQARQVVQDLRSITRALLHPGDRVAWLAILRMPGIALSMADLTHLVGSDHQAPVLELVAEDNVLKSLDSESRKRAEHFVQVMTQAQQAAGRGSLRDTVYAAWLDIGGAWCLADASDMDDASAYLDLLEAVESSGDRSDLLDRLDHQMQKLYAAPQPDSAEAPSASRVQLMTVHKAKGLEFDGVILPGLHGPTGSDSARLLEWLEQDNGFLAAAYQRRDDDRAPGLYEFIKAANRRKAEYEMQRVLYVAATRARERLCLPLTVKVGDKGALSPAGGKSMLGLLWPALGEQTEPLEVLASEAFSSNDTKQIPEALPLLRFDHLPESPSGLLKAQEQATQAQLTEWLAIGLGDAQAQAEGTALHYLLEVIHNQGRSAADIQLEDYAELVDWVLLEHDVSGDELLPLRQKVLAAARQVLEDKDQFAQITAIGKARSYAELELLERNGATIRTHIIDRAYVEAGGRVQIIDYKLTNQDPADNEKWQAQLVRYRDLWARMEPTAEIHADILSIRPWDEG